MGGKWNGDWGSRFSGEVQQKRVDEERWTANIDKVMCYESSLKGTAKKVFWKKMDRFIKESILMPWKEQVKVGILLLMAALQPMKGKVRPVLDLRKLNKTCRRQCERHMFFLFVFFHHMCESTCDTLASSAANQGDNTVSVAQGGTATPGATKQLLLPDRVFKRNIYVYTKSRHYIGRLFIFILVQFVI